MKKLLKLFILGFFVCAMSCKKVNNNKIEQTEKEYNKLNSLIKKAQHQSICLLIMVVNIKQMIKYTL